MKMLTMKYALPVTIAFFSTIVSAHPDSTTELNRIGSGTTIQFDNDINLLPKTNALFFSIFGIAGYDKDIDESLIFEDTHSYCTLQYDESKKDRVLSKGTKLRVVDVEKFVTREKRVLRWDIILTRYISDYSIALEGNNSVHTMGCTTFSNNPYDKLNIGDLELILMGISAKAVLATPIKAK